MEIVTERRPLIAVAKRIKFKRRVLEKANRGSPRQEKRVKNEEEIESAVLGQ